MGWEDADGSLCDGWPTILVSRMFGTQSRETKTVYTSKYLLPEKTSLGLVFSPTVRLDSQ